MKKRLKYADIHSHPNLHTYGSSFGRISDEKKQDVWYRVEPNFFAKLLNMTTGIAHYSQCDFTTQSRGGAKLIFVSLYPFEKGFFSNLAGNGPLSAYLSNLLIGIGYHRIRYIQNHTDYFKDLEQEYNFFVGSRKEQTFDNETCSWKLVRNREELTQSLKNPKEIAVLLSIEGAHVLNTGLSSFERPTSEVEVLENLSKIKQWDYPPFFITFAHNFYNDLCGHAVSLKPIEKFVDQSEGLNRGFTLLGKRVLHKLLSADDGHPIYIDVKHMSLQARKEYYEILAIDYAARKIPIIVSHGAINGRSFDTSKQHPLANHFWSPDINFFDEEIIEIAKSGGLFGLQFDGRRIAGKGIAIKTLNSLFNKNQEDVRLAALLIWRQLQYVAELLDQHGLFAWGTLCIGSDYGGSIDPLPGVWTPEEFPSLWDNLLVQAREYLQGPNPLTAFENRQIDPEEIVSRFFLDNVTQFTLQHLPSSANGNTRGQYEKT